MKISKKGASLFIDEYNRLAREHGGKFQDAPSFEKSYITDFIQQLLDSKINIDPLIVKGKWCEIDTPQDLEKARRTFS